MSATPQVDLTSAESLIKSVEAELNAATTSATNLYKHTSGGVRQSASNALNSISLASNQSEQIAAMIADALGQITPPTPPAPPAPPVPVAPMPNGPSGSATLTFQEEFAGSAVDTTTWNTCDGWADQNNVTDRAANLKVANSILYLTLASESSGAQVITNKAGLAVGSYVEFFALFTSAKCWPALWSGKQEDWPKGGENDIAEGLGTMTVNYHSPSGAHNQGTIPGSWFGSWHSYGCKRNQSSCDVYWDGKLVKSYPTDDNGELQYIALTMGSNGKGDQIGAQLQVDSVRTWTIA